MCIKPMASLDRTELTPTHLSPARFVREIAALRRIIKRYSVVLSYFLRQLAT